MDGRDDNASDSDAYSDPEDSDDDDPYCNACDRHFISTNALNSHLAYSPNHNWCFDCSRDFGSYTSLEQVRIPGASSLDSHYNYSFCASASGLPCTSRP